MGNGRADDLLTPEGRIISKERSIQFRTGMQRFERPVYDYPTKYSPCRAGCPAGHDIAWALFFVARGRPDLALQIFKEESPFPAITGRVCYHPCELVCNRGHWDEPIAIHALERSFADRGRPDAPPQRIEPVYPETVGIVGAGPAGLTAAYHLVRLGYRVTVYDANPEPGGVLAFGIPPYRLPRDILRREIADLEAMGIEFRCSTRIGRDIGWEELEARHQALFVAVGLSRPRPLGPSFPQDPRLQAGLDLLRQVSLRNAPRLHGQVRVIGGGDVAVDVARSALRLGAKEVWICSLEQRSEMPAHPEEIEAALREGVHLRNGVALMGVEALPQGLRLRFGKVKRFRRESDGSVAYEVDEVATEVHTAAFAFYAIGQMADLSFLPEPLCHRPRLEVGPFGETERLGLFAGGDIVGTYNVVNAIASAKRAVVGIDAYLRGFDPREAQARIRLGSEQVLSLRAYRQWREGDRETLITTGVPFAQINTDYFPHAPRQPLPEAPFDGSRPFGEVVASYDWETMLQEAERCFNCGICNLCGNCYLFCPDAAILQRRDGGFEIDLVHCKGCGVCVEECPRGAMAMVPERELREEEG